MLFNTENISSSCQEACQCRRGVGPEMMAILGLGNVKTFGKKTLDKNDLKSPPRHVRNSIGTKTSMFSVADVL